ncbi:MAG: hypothetical protein JO182_26210 [Acidobacteriaceae bacterium]|nr:hypothetical protein [Acidobacteriaceae bacterium]
MMQTIQSSMSASAKIAAMLQESMLHITGPTAAHMASFRLARACAVVRQRSLRKVSPVAPRQELRVEPSAVLVRQTRTGALALKAERVNEAHYSYTTPELARKSRSAWLDLSHAAW